MGDVLRRDRGFQQISLRWPAHEARHRSEKHFEARVNAWNRRYIGEQQAEGFLRRSVAAWATKVAKDNPPKIWRELDRDTARQERNAGTFSLRSDERATMTNVRKARGF